VKNIVFWYMVQKCGILKVNYWQLKWIFGDDWKDVEISGSHTSKY
jgi:hypothetical protein